MQVRKQAINAYISGPEAEGTMKSKPTSSDVESPAGTAKPWWQWVLLYPTLVISLIGSVPTAIELIRSNRTGVPFGESSAAIKQGDLWSKNMGCTEAPFDGVVNESNVKTDATICKSGDVLVRFKGPHEKSAYRWVPVETFETRTASSFLLSEAYADTAPQAKQETLICQWSPEQGWVIRRVREEGTNRCFNEKVRTYTGEVVSRQPVACEQACGS